MIEFHFGVSSRPYSTAARKLVKKHGCFVVEYRDVGRFMAAIVAPNRGDHANHALMQRVMAGIEALGDRAYCR